MQNVKWKTILARQYLENLIGFAKFALGACVGFSSVYWLDIFQKNTSRSPLPIFDRQEIWCFLTYAIGSILGAVLVPLVLDLCKFFDVRAIVRIALMGFFIGIPVGFLVGGLLYPRLEEYWNLGTRISGWIGSSEERGLFLCTVLGAMLGVIVPVSIYIWRVSRMRLESEPLDRTSS